MSPKLPRNPFRNPEHDGGTEQLGGQIDELKRELEQLRNELAEKAPSQPSPSEPTEDEKARLIEQARAELPELDEKLERGVGELRRLAR
jgi:chromosome segregation ATPase